MPQKPEAERQPEAGKRLVHVWCGRTSKGLVRSNNEDTLWAHPVAAAAGRAGGAEGRAEAVYPGLLFCVADGMGGALAGEVASNLAVSVVATEMAARSAPGCDVPPSDDGCAQTLVAAVEAANNAIRVDGEGNAQRRGMGTTLTAAWVIGDLAVIAQVGDSRAYLFRGGHLKQVTKDQSLVGKLIEDGIITEDEAERIAGKNIILQALGSDEPLDVVIERHRLQPGDTLLLCTDGLSGVVSNKDLEDDLRRGGTPEDIVQRLIALAEKRGGPDNITVLHVRSEAPGR